jgi:hypothetical protein
MNYRSVFLATIILIEEKLSTNCLIARHLDEKSRDCKQRILLFYQVVTTCYQVIKWHNDNKLLEPLATSLSSTTLVTSCRFYVSATPHDPCLITGLPRLVAALAHKRHIPPNTSTLLLIEY